MCDGEDVGAVLGAIVKGRGLTQVTARALEHSDPRQALRVSPGMIPVGCVGVSKHGGGRISALVGRGISALPPVCSQAGGSQQATWEC